MSDKDDLTAKTLTDTDTIEATFRREAPALTRYFHRRLRGAADPIDLVQEAFARLVRRSAEGAIDNPAALVTRIARNLLIDHGRRQKKRADHEDEFDPAMDAPIAPPQIQQLETTQMMERFRQSVDRLPPRTRQIFLLHHVDELLYREIAERLEISVRTVEWHMSEALLRLRRMMDER